MPTDNDYRSIQVIALLVKWLVLWFFAFGILAYQVQKKRYPRWPMPGAYVGAGFLMIDGLLPLHMALTRLGWLPWTVYSLEATVLFSFIAINSSFALARWWKQGFEDTPGPWGDKPATPYRGRDDQRTKISS